MARPTPYSIALCLLIAFNDEINGNKEVDEFLEIIFENPVWSDKQAPSISWLLNRYQAQLGELQTDLYKRWLERAVTSMDSLIDLMETLKYTDLHKHSLYGSYVQRVVLGFNTLDFEEVLQLFNDFSDQIQQDHDSKHVEPHNSQWTISDAEMEAQLREQCFRIQESSQPLAYNKLEHQLDELLAHNPELYSGYFMDFLIQICKGERAGSINSLFRYMDFGLTDHDSLQFGSILLASLFEAFGDTKLVRVAIEEAICISQQSSDQHSVIYALGKLGEGTANKDYLKNCVNRARENQLQHLVAGASLTLAELYSSWKDLENAVCEPAKTTEILEDRPVRIRNIEQSSAMTLITRHLLVAASIWEYYGETSLSLQTCRSALQNHEYLSATDTRLCIENIARFRLYRSDGRCVYEAAVERYQNMIDRHLVAASEETCLDLFLALIVLEWTIRRGELMDAEDLLSAIESHMYPRLDNYKNLVIDVASQKAFLLSRQSRWDEAAAILKSTIESLSGAEFSSAKMQLGRLLLQLATTYLESSNNTRFSCVLPPLMECLTLSEKEKMHGLHAAANSILAHVHLRQDNVIRSIKTLRAVMPSLLRSEQVSIQAEAHLTLAKCHMKRFQESKNKRALQSAERDLMRSKELLLDTQDLLRLQEVLYLHARVYDALGDETLRDYASQEFVTITQTLRQNRSRQTGIVVALSSDEGIDQDVNARKELPFYLTTNL